MDLLDDLKNQFMTYYDDLIIIMPKLIVAILLVFIFIMIARFLRKRFIKFIYSKVDDKLLINFFNSILRIVIWAIGFLMFLYILGMSGLAGSILGAATISSVVIGFAFKDIAENFLAGVILAFNRPFRIHDVVRIMDVEGVIIEMNLRDTHLKTGDGKDVFIPNGQIIKNPLYNYTIDGFLRKNFVIGLDYATDVDLARKIIAETLATVPGILGQDKMPQTLIKDFGPSTINIEIRYWVNTFKQELSAVEIHSQAMKNVLRSLEDAQINLPGDIIEIKDYMGNHETTSSASE